MSSKASNPVIEIREDVDVTKSTVVNNYAMKQPKKITSNVKSYALLTPEQKKQWSQRCNKIWKFVLGTLVCVNIITLITTLIVSFVVICPEDPEGTACKMQIWAISTFSFLGVVVCPCLCCYGCHSSAEFYIPSFCPCWTIGVDDYVPEVTGTEIANV